MNTKLLLFLPILLLSLCSSVCSMNTGDNNFGDNFNEFFEKGPSFSEEFYKPSEQIFPDFFMEDPWPYNESLVVENQETFMSLNFVEPLRVQENGNDLELAQGNEQVKSPLKKIKKQSKKAKKKKIKKNKKEDFEYLLEGELQDEDAKKFVGKRKLARKTTKKSLKKYKCDSKDCKEVFISKNDLRKHKANEGHFTEEEKRSKPYVCEVCGLCYSRIESLNRHKSRENHNLSSKGKRKKYQKREDADREKKFHCKELNCNKKYASMSALKKHMWTKHRKKEDYEYVSEGGSEDKDNDMNFLVTENKDEIFSKKLKWSKKKWICECCGIRFRNKQKMYEHKLEKNHYTAKEIKETPYFCNVCGLRYRAKRSRDRHKRGTNHILKSVDDKSFIPKEDQSGNKRSRKTETTEIKRRKLKR